MSDYIVYDEHHKCGKETYVMNIIAQSMSDPIHTQSSYMFVGSAKIWSACLCHRFMTYCSTMAPASSSLVWEHESHCAQVLLVEGQKNYSLGKVCFCDGITLVFDARNQALTLSKVSALGTQALNRPYLWHHRILVSCTKCLPQQLQGSNYKLRLQCSPCINHDLFRHKQQLTEWGFSPILTCLPNTLQMQLKKEWAIREYSSWVIKCCQKAYNPSRSRFLSCNKFSNVWHVEYQVVPHKVPMHSYHTLFFKYNHLIVGYCRLDITFVILSDQLLSWTSDLCSDFLILLLTSAQ